MPSADAWRGGRRSVMRRNIVRLAVLLAVAVGVSGCADGFSPLSRPAAPEAVEVAPLRPGAVRVSWARVDAPDVSSYVIERRADLSGPFAQVAQIPQTGLARALYIDTNVNPDTYYGYRILTLSGVGDRSGPSVVGGARTPPPPGIEITTATIGPTAGALDDDGYEVVLHGPDSLSAPIGVNARQRFAPLRPGTYIATLRGIASRCSPVGDSIRTAVVTDTTAVTTVALTFNISCRDPNRGEIDVNVAVSGDSLDPEFFADVLGQAADTTLPDTARFYSARRSLPTANPRTRFQNLRPGVYEVSLDDVADNCVVSGPPVRIVSVGAQTTVPVGFSVVCEGDEEPVSTAPFVWRNTWSAAADAPGSQVTLALSLDLTADTATRLLGVQADVRYDPTVLRFDEEEAGQLPIYTINSSTPGLLSFIANTSPTSLRRGVVSLINFRFTVVGDSGATTRTSTENLKASDRTSAGILPISDSVRVVEATFTVGGGNGTGSQNTPPLAVVNGPYSGVVGTPIAFSSVGSNDPGGSIVSYLWSFGDNATSTAANPTKTYASSGSFPVTLTVTDNEGAATTASTTATVLPPTGGGNQPPVARANGPYSATVGIPFTLSAGGSFDPDGSVVLYQWLLGDGRTVTGASPSVSYSAPGTYNVTLTVSDNLGATASASSTVVVSPTASSQPLQWRTVFGPVDLATRTVSVTVSYDMRTDITETSGAEALQTFSVDSLRWSASLLQFQSINLGPNIAGTSNQAGVNGGVIAFGGTIGGAQQQGLITIATVRFRIVGSTGAVVNTVTRLGPLIGAASTGFFVYNGKTSITEGQLVLP